MHVLIKKFIELFFRVKKVLLLLKLPTEDKKIITINHLNGEKVAFRLKFQLLFRLSLVFVETTVSSKVINFERVP